YSIAHDLAGNTQPTPSAAQATVQIVSTLTVGSITPVAPNPRNTTVDAMDVTFSEPIDLSTFDTSDVTLTRNGGSVPLSALTFAPVSGATYRIGGLSAFDGSDGLYTLTVDAHGIEDPNEIPGTGSQSISGLTDPPPPTSGADPLPPATPASTIAVSVTGSDPNGVGGSPASGLDSFDIYSNTDGGAYALWTTVTPASPSAVFTGTVGH